MPAALLVIVGLLLLANAFALVYWTIVLARVSRLVRRRPTVRRGLELPPPEARRLSIVVPVHNEQRTINACCGSLRHQRWPALELIFVLDRCTDATRQILERHAGSDDRVILVDNDTCPEGWAGKCNAARLGAERATGHWLLFTDADTLFSEDLARAAIALAEHHDLDLLSLLSSLTYERPHEWLAQAVATMHLVRMYPIDRVNRTQRPRPFANGQFMLFRRSAYDAIGGHAAVKDDLLEDLAFARRVAESGGRGGVFLADRMLVCSMYETLEGFRRGWKRIFIEACKRRPGRLRKNGWRVLTAGVILPGLQAASLATGAALALAGHSTASWALLTLLVTAVSVQVIALLAANALAGASLKSLLCYPIGCWIVGRLMLDGARDLERRRPIEWGGRTYVLEPR